MKKLTFWLLILVLTSCAAKKPRFVKENVCTNESLKYLKNPRNKNKKALVNPRIVHDVAKSSSQMQGCYEDFKNRTGVEEFHTCLVVGIDEKGSTEFYNLGSRQIKLDQKFLNCAKEVSLNIPYSQYGRNYILIQSFKFYLSDK
jgi:hypothetical protein